MAMVPERLGINEGYVAELYELYREDPQRVSEEWRRFFAEGGFIPSPDGREGVSAAVEGALAARAMNLGQAIRHRGHLAARLDPLGSPPPGDPALDPAYHGLTEADLSRLPADLFDGPLVAGARHAGEVIQRWRQVYCGTIGYDFSHIQDRKEREWLIEAIESGRFRVEMSPDLAGRLLERLTQVEVLERFLHRAYVGHKRFSIEGLDLLIPILDEILAGAVAQGAKYAAMGMAHRGRINVLAHILGKPYEMIVREFSGVVAREAMSAAEGGTLGYTGDVTYHLGREGTVVAGLKGILANNPSHLEFVNPVVEGIARALQEEGDGWDPRRALPILIHGDAAFPGEGVVAETLNLSRLEGYRTGGTIHIILNNQLGFTTDVEDARSTFYASDVARGFEIPVLHINADRVEDGLLGARLALAYRQTFHKDIVIDLIGYRRWGHNEGDEPSFTQPLMYKKIQEHPTVREIWQKEGEARGLIPEGLGEELVKRYWSIWQGLKEKVEAEAPKEVAFHLQEAPEGDGSFPEEGTALSPETVERLKEEIYRIPPGFTLHPKLVRQVEERREALREGKAIDWAQGELLALGSLLMEGVAVRLTGQDTLRGTFSQRHVAFYDYETGEKYIPLQHLPSRKAPFYAYNSPLTEAAAVGFEYGYSLHKEMALVLWEAQFGDFANVAQVYIDQFLASAWAKWREASGLVLLLPHGYEGQGPEHSSARLERFLQLCAQENLRVINPTTPAQYFHALRRQAFSLKTNPRPLIVMTPKSLLRHPLARSTLEEFTQGGFHPVLDDPLVDDPGEVRRVLLCSGKVYVDLLARRQKEPRRDLACIRVEQLYPFPRRELEKVLRRYEKSETYVWLQEEPRNMGAWTFMAPRLKAILGEEPLYVGRPPLASPAEGFAELHQRVQEEILREALGALQVKEG
ncbi:MAG: 2-oxoglutarate dehydrogenase E1 component [Clostridiales bacterium]|nr:2-oxoglutarate dehydrogenase E1 component [Clostridiales bacterium]